MKMANESPDDLREFCTISTARTVESLSLTVHTGTQSERVKCRWFQQQHALGGSTLLESHHQKVWTKLSILYAKARVIPKED
jgi:hypothetical protein